MAIILTVILIMFIILLMWSWHSLGNIETKSKIIIITVSIIVIYIITWLIFTISKLGIIYGNKEGMNTVETVFSLLITIVFSIINGYVIMPYVFRNLERINNVEVEKENITKIIKKVLIIILILAIFEIFYFKNIQNGMINMLTK